MSAATPPMPSGAHRRWAVILGAAWAALGFNFAAAATEDGAGDLTARVTAAASANTSQIDLSWTDNATNEGSFRVERRTQTGTYEFVGNAPLVANKGGTGTYRDTALPAFVTYTYRVRAENAAGVSAWTNEVTATTKSSIPVKILSQPVPSVVRQGNAASFAVTVQGESLSYQWRRNGVDLPGQTGLILYLPTTQSTDAGVYTVHVSNPGEAVDSIPAQLTLATSGSSRLINLSARAFVGTGDSQLVPGLVISGSGQKKLLVRAVGPRLANFGVTTFLADPTMAFYRGSTVTAANNDWGTFSDLVGLEATRLAVSAFSLNAGSKDAALLVNAAAGPFSYTVPTSGVGGGTGVALVEIYDADPANSASQLINLSARAFAGIDDNVINAGFVIGGDVALKLLIRGAGPALAAFGVGNTLAEPTLTLYRVTSSGNIAIASNSRWDDNSNLDALNTAITSTGAFPFAAGSGDAALLLVLPPGSYTVQLTGVNRTTGNALVELYAVP